MRQRRCSIAVTGCIYFVGLVLFSTTTRNGFLFSSNHLLFVSSKEIEATKEWTLLGENDTVAAGMHIRMDLETGQKWVKLLDEEEDDNSNNKANEHGTTVGSTTTKREGESLSSKQQPQEARISSNGALIVSGATDENSISGKGKETEGDNAEEGETGFDFDMMHRTLSQLPPEEKEQMMLPEALPPTTASPELRAKFEERMKQIWWERQAFLKEFESEFVADLPQILRDRIARLQDYMEDPVAELRAIQTEPNSLDGDDQVTHIISVLQDLEFQLTDIDMTRDFYTLGGFPLIVSLISSNIHEDRSNHTLTDELRPLVHSVQAHAAWVFGTAVKNTLEFAPFALEEVKVGNRFTTALDVLVEELLELDYDEVLQSSSEQRFHKYLYTLGSILRGNRIAQSKFCVLNAPSTLGRLISKYVESSDISSSHAKATKRLLNLAEDIVTDVQLHESKSKQIDDAIIYSFSTEPWCSAIVRAIQIQSNNLQETALNAASRLSAHCSSTWEDGSMRESLTELSTRWQNTADGMDPEIRQERLALLNSLMKDS